MILVELIIKIMEIGTDILLKMGFYEKCVAHGHFRNDIAIQDGRHLCRFKHTSDIIFDGIEENSWFCCLQYSFQLW